MKYQDGVKITLLYKLVIAHFMYEPTNFQEKRLFAYLLLFSFSLPLEVAPASVPNGSELRIAEVSETL